MEVLGVSKREVRDYIPAHGWGQVETILNAYADGAAISSKTSTDKLVDDVAQSSGGVGAAFLLIGLNKSFSNDFVSEMIKMAKFSLKNNSFFRRSYQYDGQGRFFKTTVEIILLDRDQNIFGVSFLPSDVGKKAEEELAEKLNIKRAIERIQINLKIDLEDETDEEECSDEELFVRSGLQTVLLHTCDITTEQISAKIKQGSNAILDDNTVFVLPGNKKFSLSLSSDLTSGNIQIRLRAIGGGLVWDPNLQKELIEISERIYSDIKKKLRMAA